jgi:hypothetical protein
MEQHYSWSKIEGYYINICSFSPVTKNVPVLACYGLNRHY